MQLDKSYICTKKLIDTQTPEKRGRLLTYLSESGRAEYEKIPAMQTAPLQNFTIEELLGKLHPSHYQSLFSSLSHEMKIAYISALPPHVRREVVTNMSIVDSLYDYEDKIKDHFQHQIMGLMTKEKGYSLPNSYIPEDPLLFLVECDTIQMGALVSFLGLFDLHGEIKSLINGKLLMQLEEALSDDELRFLKEIEKHKKKQVLFEPMGLNRWNGEISVLRNVMKERGINRLAKALTLSPPDLLWLVMHIMDTSMMMEFKKYRAELSSREVTDILREQVKLCWDSLCTVSH